MALKRRRAGAAATALRAATLLAAFVLLASAQQASIQVCWWWPVVHASVEGPGVAWSVPGSRGPAGWHESGLSCCTETLPCGIQTRALPLVITYPLAALLTLLSHATHQITPNETHQTASVTVEPTTSLLVFKDGLAPGFRDASYGCLRCNASDVDAV